VFSRDILQGINKNEKETQEPDWKRQSTNDGNLRENAGKGSQPSERNLQASKPHLSPILDRDADSPAKRQPEDGGGGREAPGRAITEGMARLVAAPPQNGRAAGWEREIRGRWLMSWSLAGGDGKGGKEGGEV